MIDELTFKIYQEQGLPLIREENCSLFHPINNIKGICNLDGNLVDISASCLNPEECYKLEQRDIEVKRI